MTSPTIRHVVFVRSDRLALVAQDLIRLDQDTNQPFLAGIESDSKPIEFAGSDVVIAGTRRQFWLIAISREHFRDLLARQLIAEMRGSKSAFVLTRGYSADVKALIERAAVAVEDTKQESSDDDQAQAAA